MRFGVKIEKVCADVLNQIIDFTFKGGTRKIIYVNKSGIANWANKKNKLDNNYTKESIIKAVSFLIHNCYFNLGGKLFKQIIGIPMGSDPAPAFANLFLFFYESLWLNKMKKSNNVKNHFHLIILCSIVRMLIRENSF